MAPTLRRVTTSRRKALVPYFSGGDPDIQVTYDAIFAAVDAGADVVEIGVPFSDPIADGSVIQASYQRALAGGASVPRILELCAKLRRATGVPLVLFGYYDPFLRYGKAKLAHDAKEAGVDGILCVDTPPEESGPMVTACRAAGIDPIFLLAPTSGEDRIDAVAGVASGFVYFVAVTGVTGARSAAPIGIESKVEVVRRRTGLPVGVGFGISNPEQAAAVAGYADLVVVGSALVRLMQEAGRSRAAKACGEFVAQLRSAIEARGCDPS
ncbi:MAG: tryptophan synthase subunit alpha [Myxococcales bacterium]|nr:MAG: tryptophan synthase subunit alpha [Myxococcales bacterium]